MPQKVATDIFYLPEVSLDVARVQKSDEHRTDPSTSRELAAAAAAAAQVRHREASERKGPQQLFHLMDTYH